MNGNGQPPDPEWIPVATLFRLEAVAKEFMRTRSTGCVTVTLHFRRGRPMPSDLVVNETGLSEEGPADVLFAVKR